MQLHIVRVGPDTQRIFVSVSAWPKRTASRSLGQIRGQRPACRMLALARFVGIGRGRICYGGTLGVSCGLVGLEFADQQFKLIDVLLELLRRAPEPSPAQHRQLHLELLDVQRLGMNLGRIGRDLELLARQLGLQTGDKRPQRV